MPKKKPDSKPPKLRPDVNEVAHRVMLEATGQAPKTLPPAERPDDEKNPVAVERGRKAEGRPTHITDIVEKMLDQGFEYSGDKRALRASLTGSIERKPQFERVKPATYSLTIWSKNGDQQESNAGAAK